MSDSAKLTFYVDAPEPLDHALQKALEILGMIATPFDEMMVDEPAATGAALPVIVQYVSKQDFESAQQTYFKIEEKDRSSTSWHPLKYRFAFNECSGLADYANKTRPIIYCLDFDFIKYQDVNNNDNIFFLDSSIWQRAVNLNSKSFLADLRSVIKYFEDSSKYWDRLVTLETLEYQTRMFKEMHLAPFGVVGHATALNLSSWAGESNAALNFVETQKSKIFLPRRFLLIDDFARQDLRKIGEENRGNQGLSDEVKPVESNAKSISKGQRIYTLLGELVQISKCEFDTVQTLKGATDAVTKKAYDMIFLDYVLDGSAEKRETGLQFLRHLTDDKKNKNVKKSVDEKLWVFPVSSFAEAFIGDMLSGEIQPVNDYFYWTCGADPVRQPNLFKKELHVFLMQQDKILRQYSAKISGYMNEVSAADSSYEKFHQYITSHQGKLEALFQNEDSQLICDFVEQDPVVSRTFASILEYLENYLRLRRFYKTSAREACERDLMCMLSLIRKSRQQSRGDSLEVKFDEGCWERWIIGQMKELVAE